MATTIDIPIDLRNPGITDNPDNAFWTVSALGADGDFGHWEYVQQADGDVYGIVAIPKNMAVTPNAKITLWMDDSGVTAQTLRMVVSGEYIASGEDWSPAALNDFSEVLEAAVPAVADQIVESVTAAIAAPVAGDLVQIRILHNGAHANDTLTTNPRLHAAFLRIDLA